MELDTLPAHVFRIIIQSVAPFCEGKFTDVADLMRLAVVSTHARRLIVAFLSDHHTAERARAHAFSSPHKFSERKNFPYYFFKLGLLLPPDPMSMLPRDSTNMPRYGSTPKDWSLANVGSIAMRPFSDSAMRNRLALLTRAVPKLHDVHVLMPVSSDTTTNSNEVRIELRFPATVLSASIGSDHNDCPFSSTVSGSSVISGEGIVHFMVLAPRAVLRSMMPLQIPNVRSLLLSCNVLSFVGLGRLAALRSLALRVEHGVTRSSGMNFEFEPGALACIGEVHWLQDLSLHIQPTYPVPSGALVSLTQLCSLEVHGSVRTLRALVQVAGLSLRCMTKLCILRSDRTDRASLDLRLHQEEPLCFMHSATSLAHLAIQWYENTHIRLCLRFFFLGGGGWQKN